MLNSILASVPVTVEFRLLAYLILALSVVLAVPRLFERMQLPGLLGLILANDRVIELFAEIGKLMLMFLIGLEINLNQFNRVRLKAIAFGALTFAAPLLIAAFIARHNGYSWISAILIGSLLASHTLLAFPLLEKAGLVEREAATVTVGATIFTDIAALSTLAICASIHSTGLSERQIAIQAAELLAFVLVVVFGLGVVGRRLVDHFRNSDDGTLVVMLLVMAVASIGAVLIRLEDIIGAFLAGLAVNSVARSSHTRETIRLLGHTLFIPAFFFAIGTKLLIGPLAAQILNNPAIVIGLVVALFTGKLIAAGIAATSFGYTSDERGMMWSLTLPQVAATLAAAFVAFEVRNAQGARLIDEPVIAAVLLLMLLTTILGPLMTSHYASRLAKRGAG
jgi:Kef-type K+ transport system membrane component KefB